MDVVDRMLATMRHAWRAMARDGARWFERDGICGLVTPHVPERSIVNCVIPDRGCDLEPHYEWLEREFAEVNAWTVWVPETEAGSARFLQAKGHVLDADPAMMALDLRAYEPPVEPADWRPATARQLAAVNEAAYPAWQDGTMARAIEAARFEGEDFRLYTTEDAAVLGINDCDGDAGVIFVATRPEARGRGLAGRLLAAALVEARDRGCEISTLQATKMGEPVYARLGYQRFGAIQMWEKRRG